MVLNLIELDNLYKEGNLKKYITDDNRNTVLWWASDRGHLEVVKYLVEKCGADVRSDNDCAVRWASGNGHLEMVKYLVEKRGADVRADNDYAVQFASDKGHFEVVKYLVEKCESDVRVGNDVAVRWASGKGHLKVVKYLVEECEADVRACNDFAVRWASANGHLEMVKYLINHGAVLSAPNPKYEKYLLVCEKGIERASKKIYFWWVQVCYDVKRPCGNRMMRRNYEAYNKIVF